MQLQQGLPGRTCAAACTQRCRRGACMHAGRQGERATLKYTFGHWTGFKGRVWGFVPGTAGVAGSRVYIVPGGLLSSLPGRGFAGSRIMWTMIRNPQLAAMTSNTDSLLSLQSRGTQRTC